MKRRRFLKKSVLTGMGMAIVTPGIQNCTHKKKRQLKGRVSGVTHSLPIVIATWSVLKAVEAARDTLLQGENALDAVENGVKVEEADPSSMSIGKGGLPDRDGNVSLDACIMDMHGNCGSVVFLQHITHAISVARKVMEDTPHVMLAGSGALQFALKKGFKKENLLTERSKKAWEKWKKTSKYKPVINIENHDTIGMLAMDSQGDISGACTTSGLAYKMKGRVGDSPIIGSGLYVDNEIGGAVATGLGEEVIKTVGSFLIVELMRQGKTPQQACEEAVQRIIKRNKAYRDFQVAYIAVNKKGDTGAFSIHKGFTYTKYSERNTKIYDASFYTK